MALTAPVPSIKAGSLKTTSFTATWTLDALATKGYTVTATKAGTAITGSPFTVAAGTNEQAFTGLTANTEYKITVTSLAALPADNSPASAEVAISTKALAVPPVVALSWKTPPKATSTIVQNSPFAYETPVAENGTGTITVTHSTLDTSKAGTFDVTYTATDSASPKVVITAKTSVTITAAYVPMTWKTAPTATKSIVAGTAFTFETPVAKDGKSPLVVTHTPATVDTTAAGTHTITYTATDSSKPAKTLTGTTALTVTAKPAVKLANPKPVIGAVTETGLTVTWPDVPNATKYQVKVNAGGFADATSPKVIIGLTSDTMQTIIIKAIGDVTNFTDSDEVTKTKKTAKPAPVATPMVITIPNGDTQNVIQGAAFTVPTATVAGGTTAKVTATPKTIVTTGAVGSTLQVTYTATDSGSPKAADVTKVLTVTITAKAKVYSVALKGQANSQFEAVRGTFEHEVDELGNPVTNVYKELNADVKDATNKVDTRLSNKLVQTWDKPFNPNAVGTYVATYTLSAANNPTGGEIKATRTVKIVDTTKPVISLTHSAKANVAKGFDIGTIYPATTATIKASDNAGGTLVITKADVKVGSVTTRTFTVTDVAGNASTVQVAITELADLNVSVPDINRDTHTHGAITPVPATPNAIGTVTYVYNPDIGTIKPGTVKDTTVTVTATEVLTHGTRTGTATFKVSISMFKPDTGPQDFLDGKHIFMSNYSKFEGDGTPNTDTEIETAGTEYEKAVKLAVADNKLASNTTAVWYDEAAMDPYERRAVADSSKKNY